MWIVLKIPRTAWIMQWILIMRILHGSLAGEKGGVGDGLKSTSRNNPPMGEKFPGFFLLSHAHIFTFQIERMK
jgi:hypothetical protein